MLGIIRGRQQRYAEAEALFRRVAQLNPKSLTAVHNLAGALLAQDKPDEALKEYQRAVDLAPHDVPLRLEAAQLALAGGSYSKALAFLDGIKPDHFPPEAAPVKAASLLGLDRKSDAEALIPVVKTSPSAAMFGTTVKEHSLFWRWLCLSWRKESSFLVTRYARFWWGARAAFNKKQTRPAPGTHDGR